MDLTGLGDVQTLLDPTSSGEAMTAAGVSLAVNLLPIGRIGGASSRALARALEVAGHVRAPGAAAHHLVPGGAKAAGPAREVLGKFGIGINDAANGVFLGGSVHSGIHTNAYYETVNELLGGATSRQQALDGWRLSGKASLTVVFHERYIAGYLQTNSVGWVRALSSNQLGGL
jgi:hypothetical protein